MSLLSRVLLAALASFALVGAADARVVPKLVAQQAGLKRAWFTQAAIDASTQSVAGAVLDGDSLYVLSSAGVLQALDAETGVTRWTARLGSPYQPAVGPAVGQGHVSVVVGSTLSVLDSTTGAIAFDQKLRSPAIAAPAIGEKAVFVPGVTGHLMAYPLDRTTSVPYIVASPGALAGAPIVGEQRLLWTTARGELYGASVSGGSASGYRMDAGAPLAGQPVLDGPTMYFATTEGVVNAMDAARARPVWRTSVAGSVSKPAVVVAGMVFVVTDASKLYAMDAANGELLWSVEGLSDFVSASETHVFAVAPDRALGVLDRETGRPVASWPAVGALTPIVNDESDRLYFVSGSGLVQCFHEEGLEKPYLHAGMPEEEAAAPVAEDQPAVDEDVDEPADEPAMDLDDEPADGGDPFDPFAPADEGADEEAEPADDPFSSDAFSFD